MEAGDREKTHGRGEMWMSGMGSRGERPGARVWSARPPPEQLRMARRGLIGRVRGKTPKGVAGDLCSRLRSEISLLALSTYLSPNLA